MSQPMHIMYYLLTKEQMQMAFGGVGVDGAACGCGRGFGAGIAAVVVLTQGGLNALLFASNIGSGGTIRHTNRFNKAAYFRHA